MSGYGCHSFRMINSEGEAVFVKFHWQCHQEKEQLTWEETEKIQGVDPDYSKRELFELIEAGGEVKWTLFLQVMKPEEVNTIDFDPFDVTKVIVPRRKASPCLIHPNWCISYQRSGRAHSFPCTKLEISSLTAIPKIITEMSSRQPSLLAHLSQVLSYRQIPYCSGERSFIEMLSISV